MDSRRRLRYVDPHKPRGRLYHETCRFSVTRVGAWLAVKIAWKLDPVLLELTRGRLSSAWPVRAALLETVGARTGRRRRTATLYFHDGEDVILVAALRGWPRNPAWYHNLRKHPEVVFGGLPFRAEAVEGEREWERLWALAERIYPPYAHFREDARKAGREIPLVRLEPVARRRIAKLRSPEASCPTEKEQCPSTTRQSHGRSSMFGAPVRSSGWTT